jgi:hypothetical protein
MLLAHKKFSPQRATEKKGEPQWIPVLQWPSVISVALCGLVFLVSSVSINGE